MGAEDYVFAANPGRRPGLAIAGLAGALLTAASPLLQAWLGPWTQDILGAWLGLTLAVSLAFAGRDPSPAKALALVAASAAAWTLAFQITFWAALPFYDQGHVNAFVILSLFLGGFTGAAILAISAFYLYGEGRELMPQRILACSVAGGALGTIAYGLGLTSSGGRLSGMAASVFYVLWQTGVALCMGLVWPARDATTTEANEPRPLPRRRVPFPAKIFVATVVLPVVWSQVQGLMVSRRIHKTDAAVAAYRAQHPPLQGMPQPAVNPDEQMLILSPIGGRPVKFAGHYLDTARPDLPQTVVYNASYKNPADAFENIEFASATVTQYPTVEWASYSVTGTGLLESVPLGERHETVVTTFGQPVTTSSLGVFPTDVYWQSGVFAVRVRSPIGNADEFVRAYLSKYPSTP